MKTKNRQQYIHSVFEKADLYYELAAYKYIDSLFDLIEALEKRRTLGQEILPDRLTQESLLLLSLTDSVFYNIKILKQEKQGILKL